jgi:hypothetical protein
MYYLLTKDKKIKKVEIEEWMNFFEDVKNRQLFKDTFKRKGSKEDVLVSTVFLGINHNFMGGKPLLFETMVFNSETELDGEPFRYETFKQAEKGHYKILEKLKKLI